jgi:heptosyltransferase-2/heptosyltransferase-3
MTTRVRDAILPVSSRTRRKDWPPVDDTILIFQPDHLGDILLSQPAVRWLRQRHPDSRLVAVVGPWSRQIASLSWPVDDVVDLSFPGFTRTGPESPIAPYRQLRAESQRLEALRARLAYVLRPDAWWSAWLASLVAPEVVTANDPRSAAFATRTAELGDDEHASVRSFRIASAGELAQLPTWSTSPLTLPADSSISDEAGELLGTSGVTGRYAVVHPGSGAAVKEWPIHRWKSVIDALVRDGQPVILTGSDAESGLCSMVANGVTGCSSLAGRTSVRVLAEVLRGATVVLGPDCGPLHLAVAAGTPTVHLFGPSDPTRYGPWGDPSRHRVVSANWLCPRCGDLSPDRDAGCGCMLAIQPGEVVDAARSVLSQHVV